MSRPIKRLRANLQTSLGEDRNTFDLDINTLQALDLVLVIDADFLVRHASKTTPF